MLDWLKDKPFYYCKRLRMVAFLRDRGFYPERILPDYDNPRYNVWIYRNSEELEAAVEEFLIQQANRPK